MEEGSHAFEPPGDIHTLEVPGSGRRRRDDNSVSCERGIYTCLYVEINTLLSCLKYFGNGCTAADPSMMPLQCDVLANCLKPTDSLMKVHVKLSRLTKIEARTGAWLETGKD